MQKGDTALHIAVRSRYRRIAEIILKDPRSARLLYQTNRAGETPYRIDQRHKKSILRPVLGNGYRVIRTLYTCSKLNERENKALAGKITSQPYFNVESTLMTMTIKTMLMTLQENSTT